MRQPPYNNKTVLINGSVGEVWFVIKGVLCGIIPSGFIEEEETY